VSERASITDAAIDEFPSPLPFGDDGRHLEVDFSSEARADLVTSILCQCLRDAKGRAPTESVVREWTLHRRLQGLLAIERAGGAPASTIQLRCSATGCGESMELDLDLGQFTLHDQPPVFEVDLAPSVRAAVRLPTGTDHRRWQATGSGGEASEARMARDLVQTIHGRPLPDGQDLPQEWIARLAEALEERDPLTALRLATRCPACGATVDLELDLEAHLLAGARMRRSRLLDAVHQLSLAYHWSEREILALPRQRREEYLARLRAEALP
jgi:hypothetical protein